MFFECYIATMGAILIMYGLTLFLSKVCIVPNYAMLIFKLFTIGVLVSTYYIQKEIHYIPTLIRWSVLCTMVYIYYRQVGVYRIVNIKIDEFKNNYTNDLKNMGLVGYITTNGIKISEYDDKEIRIYENGLNNIKCDMRDFRGTNNYKTIYKAVKCMKYTDMKKYYSLYPIEILIMGIIYIFIGVNFLLKYS